MARITWILVLVARLAACGTASDLPEDVDHPLDGRTFKLWTTGSDGDAWERGISWSGGHWLYASYPKMTDVMPVLFKAVPGYPNQYKLQNTWGFELLNRPEQKTWISFANAGTWLRTTYSEHDAMPIYFDRVVSTITTKENNTLKEYKMKNMYPGQDKWISFRDSDKALRAIYPMKEAMNVALFDVEVHDGPDMHGRMPCSSGECHGRDGCSRDGECLSGGNCLCACIPPWEPQSCSIEAAIVNTMSTLELATAKEIPEQGWISMPAITVGAGVAAAFGLFVVLEAKRRFAIQQPDGFVAMPADDVQPSC